MDEIKREKARLQSIRWRAAHAEQHRASVKAWRLANPEKVRERDIRRLARDKAKRKAAREAKPLPTPEETEAAKAASDDKRRTTNRASYLANRERTCEQDRKRSKAWREANRDRQNELVKAWKRRNVEKVRLARNGRKTRKRITLSRDLLKLQRGRCAYCRIKLGDEFHVDHVMPLKRGGPDKR